MESIKEIENIVCKEFGKKPSTVNSLSGGSINRVYHLVVEKVEFVIKINLSNRFPTMFEKEKRGLEILSHSTFKIPKPIAFGTLENFDYLVLEYIQPGSSINWEIFGFKLAQLHKITHSQFGLDHNNYIGSLEQNNNYKSTWEEFYSNFRLLPLTEKARDKQLILKSDVNKIEKLCLKLNELIPNTKPSLIHGDLWSGNLISDKNNEPVLIDPAVYYAHPEMDWAMLSLFGNYPTIAVEKYNEINPIEKDFEKRKEIHQLYPLLVHLILFGKGYYRSIMSIIEKFY